MAVLAFVLSVIAICLASLYFGFKGVSWLFGNISGWHQLESQFACDATPAWTHFGETVGVNAIRFRRCVSVAVAPDALYLRAMALFRYRPLRIPWEQMSMFQPDQIYGRAAMRFTVQGASFVIYPALYAAMYPYVAQVYARSQSGHGRR
jgi:hypothetical protein